MTKKIKPSAELLAALQLFDHKTGCHFSRLAQAGGLRQRDLAEIRNLCGPTGFKLPQLRVVFARYQQSTK